MAIGWKHNELWFIKRDNLKGYMTPFHRLGHILHMLLSVQHDPYANLNLISYVNYLTQLQH